VFIPSTTPHGKARRSGSGASKPAGPGDDDVEGLSDGIAGEVN